MLRFLSIRNLAVIDGLDLAFEPGLNVLTGETGAGKSIIVTAVGLLAGGRASGDLVRTGQESAMVEATFAGTDGTDLVIRREVSAETGRSRAFLQGALVTSTALRQAAAGLVDLHGQHEHQLLLDPGTHLDLLDAFAGLQPRVATVREAFSRWRGLEAERDRLLSGDRDRAARLDFTEFQLAEIARVNPRPGEDEELAAERQVAVNADRLQRLSAEAYGLLYDGEAAALATLGAVWKRVAELATVDSRFGPYVGLRDAVKPQLEDLAYFLRSYTAGIDNSPDRLQEIEDRLAGLERLKKKHGPTLEDVFRRREELEGEVASAGEAGSRAESIARELEAVRARYESEARALSSLRRDAALEFGGRLERALADLAMTRTRCELRLSTDDAAEAWSERGMDDAEFYISPNPGEQLRPLARIASGGELSRIMLALRTLASTDAPGRTLIFDEVDAGIGGAVANVVGARLRSLASRFQVLCITHLPQIAVYGTTHFLIAKQVRGGRTTTAVTRLSALEREGEVARMIAGSDVSPAVLASAREMLQRKDTPGPGRK